MSSELSSLLAAAVAEVRRHGATSGLVRVEVLCGGLRLVVEGLGEQAEPQAAAAAPAAPSLPGCCPACGQPCDNPPVGSWLSPTEAAIVAALGREWTSGKDLAVASGQPYSGHFRNLLANLAERGVLESGHRGYRLTYREGASS